MTERSNELPEDCWELILNLLPHHRHFDSLSLVCKQLFNLTNRLNAKLYVNDALILIHPEISSLINKRFLSINSIDFSHYSGDMDLLLLGIAKSCSLNKLHEIDVSNVVEIPIKGLKELGLKMSGIRVLKCPNVRFLKDDDLVGVGKLFPLLEELHISYHDDMFIGHERSSGDNERIISDFGIQVLSLNIRNLRRINVSGNHLITDMSLVYLAENCIFLESVDVVECTLITAEGFLFLLQNCGHLNSISVSGIEIRNGSLRSEDLSCIRLESLYIHNSSLSDEFMHMLVEAHIDLRRLLLFKCRGFTVSSLNMLLRGCDSLQHLSLSEVQSLSNESIVQLCPYLRNLVSLQLDICSSLYVNTFHMVATNCTSLKSVIMWPLCPGNWDSHLMYASIRSLNLSGTDFDDICLRGIALACPNIEMLDISYCINITEKCLSEILNTCHEIRHLGMASCRISSIGKGLELPNLEVIHAFDSNINDEGLVQIAMRCPGVLELELGFCFPVTDRGVKEVVGSCQLLRKINLAFCSNVNVSIVDWMISTRPSLLKIVPPIEGSISDIQKKFYLHRGCQVGSKRRPT